MYDTNIKVTVWKEAIDFLEKAAHEHDETDSPRESLSMYLRGYSDGRKRAVDILRREMEKCRDQDHK